MWTKSLVLVVFIAQFLTSLSPLLASGSGEKLPSFEGEDAQPGPSAPTSVSVNESLETLERDCKALYNLGMDYKDGVNAEGVNVEQDDREAVRLFTLAAEQGHVAAQNNLAYMYETGRGVEKDAHEAARWYTEAAKQGLAASVYNLGLMYVYGAGGLRSVHFSLKWGKILDIPSNVKRFVVCEKAITRPIREWGWSSSSVIFLCPTVQSFNRGSANLIKMSLKPMLVSPLRI